MLTERARMHVRLEGSWPTAGEAKPKERDGTRRLRPVATWLSGPRNTTCVSCPGTGFAVGAVVLLFRLADADGDDVPYHYGIERK